MEAYRFMMIGAHPDDMELRCGGLAMLLREKGHKVMFLSMTDGSAGHQTLDRQTMACRRREEAAATAQVFDIDYTIMPIADATLEPTLQVREMLMRQIRKFAPHVILTHRTNDYHPDHQACGKLVMDCAYLVNVPLVCPDTPCPPHTPVILSVWDPFTRPLPFSPELAAPIDKYVERKIDGCLCHTSQFYEWLPHINGWTHIQAAPTLEEKARLLRQDLRERFAREAALYPHLTPKGFAYTETFQVDEYGAPLTDTLRRIITEPVI